MPQQPWMRKLLLALMTTGLFVVPAPWPDAAGEQTGAAWADDDDDDDGDDDGGDDDDDGAGGGDRGNRRGDDDGGGRAAPRRGPGNTPGQGTVAPAAVARVIDDEIVTLGLSAAGLDVLQIQGFTVIEERSLASAAAVARRLRIPPGLSPDAARDLVRALPGGQNADFNHLYRAEQGFDPACRGADCPIRTEFGWPLPDSRAEACGAGLRVGLIDTGLNPAHATFSSAALDLVQLGTGGGQGPSGAQHGTAVAALLVGEPGTRSPGLIPQAELLAVDAFHRAGGDERADLFSLLVAMDLLAGRDIDVLNLSLSGPPNSTLEQAVRVLIDDSDIVVVAAAGNAGPASEPLYPAAIDAVIAVTAIDRERNIYRRAVQGPHIDLAAPGVSVWTAASVSGARPKTGTSFAVPFVTAAAGLLRLSDPSLDARGVAQALRVRAADLGEPGPDPVFGAGLVPAVDASCRVVPAPAVLQPASAP